MQGSIITKPSSGQSLQNPQGMQLGSGEDSSSTSPAKGRQITATDAAAIDPQHDVARGNGIRRAPLTFPNAKSYLTTSAAGNGLWSRPS